MHHKLRGVLDLHLKRPAALADRADERNRLSHQTVHVRQSSKSIGRDVGGTRRTLILMEVERHGIAALGSMDFHDSPRHRRLTETMGFQLREVSGLDFDFLMLGKPPPT